MLMTELGTIPKGMGFPEELLEEFQAVSQKHAELETRLDEHLNFSGCALCSSNSIAPCPRHLYLEKLKEENAVKGGETMTKAWAYWNEQKNPQQPV